MLSWSVALALCVILHTGFANLSLPLLVPNDLKAINACDKIADVGSEAMSSGNMVRASQAFTWGVHKCTHSSTMFNNLAVALAMLSADNEGLPRIRLLCESIASADIASMQGHADASELLLAVKQSLGQEDACRKFQRGKLVDLSSLIRRDTSNHLQNVTTFCADTSFATITPTEIERERGQWSSVQLRMVLALFHVCGVAAFEGLLPVELLADLEVARRSHADKLATSRQSKLEIAGRGKYRNEVRLPLRPPFTNSDLTQAQLLLPLVRLLVGEKAELDTFSAIETAEGSFDQVWHVDVATPDVNSDRPGSPLVGIVAVVPLVRMNSSNGATSFLAGSHVDMGNERFWVGDENGDGACNFTPRLTFSAEIGDLILFDLRLRHRGTANRVQTPRTVLYMSYVQDWFLDSTNFKAKQTRSWDEFSQSGKKMFSRLDARSYVQELEEKLLAFGVDTSLISSGSTYSRAQLEL